ncbi:hypothetical protein PG997_002147 [Apiospora hydei]|uniref:Capsule polysaccharide biosynthesis protein n=1 Tax=Apiospora hydei TaxID=1337664 RepID=A0ABR1X8J6_9PEZI
MNKITALQRFLSERGLPLPSELPESVSALAQHLRLSSYWKFAGLASVLGFAVANLKALPLAHSLRLLPSLSRLLAPRLFGRSGSKGGQKQKTASDVTSTAAALAARPALFRHNTHSSRAILLDLDINMHKSNSTFFADADVSRASLLTCMLSDALAAQDGALFILAGTQCKFLREIRPLQTYTVASQILTWTDKAFYTVTYFVSPRRGDAAAVCGLKGGPAAVLKDEKLRRKVFAIMVSKYVFKAGRATVEPAEVFGAAGLLLLNGGKDAVAKGGKKEDILSAGEVDKIMQEGMKFVRDCML